MNATASPATVAVDDTESTDGSSAVRIKLTEIFLSIQGESSTVGWPTVFVRLTGCPLRCQYCDTAYAFHGGEWFTIDTVLKRVAAHGVGHVCVTGGEPLAQKSCIPLLSALCNAGYQVSLETSGAIDIGKVDSRVSRVVDVKTPGSGEVQRNRLADLARLRHDEQIKFVICSREDFDWARDLVLGRGLHRQCTVFFSPSFHQVEARDLAQWIIDEHLPVRLQVQLHKYLWGDTPGR